MITFADDTIGGMQLKLGPEIQRMSDLDILERFNDKVAASEAIMNRWDQTVIETPVGKPQIRQSATSGQWFPVGDVLSRQAAGCAFVSLRCQRGESLRHGRSHS